MTARDDSPDLFEAPPFEQNPDAADAPEGTGAPAKPRARKTIRTVKPLSEAETKRAGAAKKDEKKRKVTPEERMKKMGLVSDWDFALHMPLRYEDETRIVKIRDLVPGYWAQIEAVPYSTNQRQTSKGAIVIVHVKDDTGTLPLVFFNFHRSNILPHGKTLRISGEVRLDMNGAPQMIHPRYALMKPGDALPTTLTPVYPVSEGLQQRTIRKRIDTALLDVDMDDPVPEDITVRCGLPGFAESVRFLPHPPAGADLTALQDRTDPHWRRLKFDELMAQQITLRETRLLQKERKAEALVPEAGSTIEDDFLKELPFELTGAQKRVVDEIRRDLFREHPMNRLVQGDVGSGKTVVAALAALRAVASGRQAVLMAPTEILAEQHFRKIIDWLTPLGLQIAWLTGKQKGSEKKAALEAIASGAAQIAVGTHALIQEGVKFAKLGLAIVDEQHRFGVAQRLALRRREDFGATPHLLMLSATPIPRTLEMSYLADLDVSVIDELPPGRQPITTKLFVLDKKPLIVSSILGHVAAGHQAYWVCPLIEESEALDLTPAVDCARQLAEALPDVRVGLMHSQLAPDEKHRIMEAFAEGEIDLLVSTTVIEVGVDVPNATLMVIEHAERFGLAQLHQLRGRVGRGSTQSTCVLLYDPNLSDTGRQRMRVIRQTTDGFEIAREDLKIRGPGEFLGERQSGMPMLRFADLEADAVLVETARDAAQEFVRRDPDGARRHARRWFEADAEFLGA